MGLLLAIPVTRAGLVLTVSPVIQEPLEQEQHQATPAMPVEMVLTAMQVLLVLMERALRQVVLETPAQQVMQAAQPLRQPIQILRQISRIAQHSRTL
jgi:hypothetical protein